MPAARLPGLLREDARDRLREEGRGVLSVLPRDEAMAGFASQAPLGGSGLIGIAATRR